jgi:hypothetical protein
MTTNILSSTTTGWIAMATGASAILAVVFLILMYTVKRSFGRVNDYFNSIIGILSVILAWLLHSAFYTEYPLMSQIALVLMLVGAIFTIIGSILAIFNYTDFVLAGWYSGIGYALIGLWLAAFCYSALRGETLPHNLIIFGIITGAFMAIGLVGIPGIIARIDDMKSLPWFLKVAFLGWFGTYMMYPIWAILLGRHLLLGG